MDERMFLKDQAMDERLAFIRKVSGLDTRHAFFVLPPTQHGDLQDFVTKYVIEFINFLKILTQLNTENI
jgi:hypothetical protein